MIYLSKSYLPPS